MTVETGTQPVPTSKWKWLGMSARAKQLVEVSEKRSAMRAIKRSRSAASRKIRPRSIPRHAMWFNDPVHQCELILSWSRNLKKTEVV